MTTIYDPATINVTLPSAPRAPSSNHSIIRTFERHSVSACPPPLLRKDDAQSRKGRALVPSSVKITVPSLYKIVKSETRYGWGWNVGDRGDVALNDYLRPTVIRPSAGNLAGMWLSNPDARAPLDAKGCSPHCAIHTARALHAVFPVCSVYRPRRSLVKSMNPNRSQFPRPATRQCNPTNPC